MDKIPADLATPRKRLTRDESKAQTRTRLMTVARAHFLVVGLGGAIAERIAEEAGYSRGAFYSNFDDMVELFLAVIDEENSRRLAKFRTIIDRKGSGKELLAKLREALIEQVMDHEWIVLHTEFGAGAFRNERIRERFLENHREVARECGKMLRTLLRSSDITLSMKPDDFVSAMMSFANGLAIEQKILGAESSESSARARFRTVFDHLISAR